MDKMTITYCFNPNKLFLRVNYFKGECVDNCPFGYYVLGKLCKKCKNYYADS